MPDRDLNEGCSQNIGLEIGPGVPGCLGRSPKQIQDGGHQCGGNRHNDHTAEYQHTEAVAEHLFGPINVLLPQFDGAQRSTSIAEQSGDGCDRGDNRSDDANGGNAPFSARQTSDVNSVHQVVDHGHQLGTDGGNKQPKQQFFDIFCTEIFCIHSLSDPQSNFLVPK